MILTIEVIVLCSLILLWRKLRKAAPPPIKSIVLRKMLRRRLWSIGVPRYCGYHLGSTLRPGQMALLDSDRCETCAKDPKKSNTYKIVNKS